MNFHCTRGRRHNLQKQSAEKYWFFVTVSAEPAGDAGPWPTPGPADLPCGGVHPSQRGTCALSFRCLAGARLRHEPQSPARLPFGSKQSPFPGISAAAPSKLSPYGTSRAASPAGAPMRFPFRSAGPRGACWRARRSPAASSATSPAAPISARTTCVQY